MTTISTAATLTAHYDEQIDAWQQQQAAQKAEIEAGHAATRERIDAAIMDLLKPITGDGTAVTIDADDRHPINRRAIVEAAGFSPIRILGGTNGASGPAGIDLRVYFKGERVHGETSGPAAALAAALMAARADYRNQEEQRQREEAREAARTAQRRQLEAEAAEQAQRRHDADTAAIRQWAPAYRRYCTELAGAYAHNAPILQGIAEELKTTEFVAARFDYGITSSDTEATTIRTWIAAQIDKNQFVEIGDNGIEEAATFWHPARLADLTTWTAAQVDAAGDRWNHATKPPIRRFQAGDLGAPAEFIGPPSAEPLIKEIARRLAEAGHELADHPQIPDAPEVSNDRLVKAAAEIEAATMTPAERAELARYLIAGRFDTEIPF